MEFSLIPTEIEGVVLIEPRVFEDGRGFFMETWSARDFERAGLPAGFVQDSHSRSVRGVLRGLHYQDGSAPMGKLVRCTAGAIFDVALDIRSGSPTFGRWTGVELTAENRRQIYIPPGFAHGFQTLTEVAEVQYKQTGYYTPGAEGTIAWNDPDVAVKWPIDPPILSGRDRDGTSFSTYKARPAFR